MKIASPLLRTVSLALALSYQAHAGSFQGLGFFESPTPESRAYAVSGDGKVVVGYSRGNDNLDFFGQGNPEAFRWTAETGMVRIPSLVPDATFEIAYGISGDGKVIVGISTKIGSEDTRAFAWTAAGGTVAVPLVAGLNPSNEAYDVSNNRVIVGYNRAPGLGGGDAMVATQRTGAHGLHNFSSAAIAISDNGRVIVGNSCFGFNFQGYSYPAVWSRSGIQKIAPPAGADTSTRGSASAVSADGTTVVGGFLFGPPFSWTKKGGTVLLPELPNARGSSPHAVSADGSVIVGESGGAGAIWTKAQGVRTVKDVMENDYGVDLSEWEGIGPANGVSADGKVIVGSGQRNGNGEAWIAILD